MSTIYNLPPLERPRERLLRYGAEVLSLQELLALILAEGTKNQSVIDISQKILSKFGSLEKISQASIEDLKEIKGVGLAKACQLKACFEIARRINFFKENIFSEKKYLNKKFITPKDIYYQVRGKIINYHKEHFIVVSLDNRHSIISVDTISVGILNRNLIHPRETFEIAIKNHSAQIIICHNHPSGDPTPSEEDILITKKLVEAGKIIGIEVIDHLIITKKNYFSFAEKKIL